MAGQNFYASGFGSLPQTLGNIYFVAPSATYTIQGPQGVRSYSASDGNDGRSPKRALLTINRAWDLVSANAGDVIMLLPGTHSPSASITADVAGVTMMGMPTGAANFLYPRTTIAAVTGDETINVTAANVRIGFLNIIPVTQKAALDFSAAANGLHVHDCYFDLNTPAAHTSTLGIDGLGAATGVLIERCYFESDGAQGAAIDVGTATRVVVQDCVIGNSAGTWAAGITVGDTTQVTIRRNVFFCYGTAMTVGIKGAELTTSNAVIIHDNRFGSLVTKGVDDFGSADAEISENYDFGVGATDGGVLVTAIT